jgi:kynurenine/2-aminoadipate aminotransferase
MFKHDTRSQKKSTNVQKSSKKVQQTLKTAPKKKISNIRSMSTTSTATTTPTSNLIDIMPFLSKLSLSREQSPTRALMPLLKIPGMVSLGSGLPNSACFPLESLSFKLKNSHTELSLTPGELGEALQYGATPGAPAFISTLKKQIQRDHTVPYGMDNFELSVTTGSQDGLTKAFEMLINPGDNIIVEKPTYSGALTYLRPLGAKFTSVEVDSEGLIPHKLDEALAKFDNTPELRPKVLYTIATGQNPSGCTTPLKRKQELYKLAQKYNLIILEDDPYFNLFYGSSKAPKTIEEYTPPTTTSYLSIDNDGRVLRFDSFSKILSSGLRLGTVCGQKNLINQLNLTTQATTLHACGLAQVIANKILTEWGNDGWDNHVKNAKYFYMKKRDLFISKLNQHLGDMVEYTTPDAGMFVFMAISPKYVGNDTNAKDLIQVKAVDAKVLLLPGESFLVDKPEKMYVRASFSTATEAEIDTALERFAGLIKKEKETRGL